MTVQTVCAPITALFPLSFIASVFIMETDLAVSITPTEVTLIHAFPVFHMAFSTVRTSMIAFIHVTVIWATLFITFET